MCLHKLQSAPSDSSTAVAPGTFDTPAFSQCSQSFAHGNLVWIGKEQKTQDAVSRKHQSKFQGLLSTHVKAAQAWGCIAEHAPQMSFLIMLVIYFWVIGQKKKKMRSNLSSESAPSMLLHLLQDFVSSFSPHSSERSFYQEDSGLTVKLKPNAHFWSQTKCLSGTGSSLSFQIAQNQLFVWDFLHKPSSWGKHSTPKYQGCALKQVPFKLGTAARTRLSLIK